MRLMEEDVTTGPPRFKEPRSRRLYGVTCVNLFSTAGVLKAPSRATCKCNCLSCQQKSHVLAPRSGNGAPHRKSTLDRTRSSLARNRKCGAK
jgi:hypothetical protein